MAETHLRAHTHACTHTDVLMHAHTYTDAHTHTGRYTYTRTHVHTHTHTRMHGLIPIHGTTHTHSRGVSSPVKGGSRELAPTCLHAHSKGVAPRTCYPAGGTTSYMGPRGGGGGSSLELPVWIGQCLLRAGGWEDAPALMTVHPLTLFRPQVLRICPRGSLAPCVSRPSRKPPSVGRCP